MQYLKTSLSGEAANLIANMEITASNFPKAWQILTERFENKRALRDAQLDILMKLPQINSESASELRNTYNKSKECVELLKGISSEQIILYHLRKILPNETRKVYEQSRVNPTAEQTN